MLWVEVGTYSQNNLRIIDVSQLNRKFGGTLSRALLGYHAFMGCDYTAAFCRKWKARPFKILENNLKCQEVFDRIGLQVKINEVPLPKLKNMYVLYVYGTKRLASVDEVRLKLFFEKYKPKESNLISNMKTFDGNQLRVLKEKINRTKHTTEFWLSSVFLSLRDPWPLDYKWIIQHQKYQVK